MASNPQGTPVNDTPGNNKYFEGAAQYIWQSEGGAYDVVANYPWTLSKTAKALNEVPYIILVEYIVDESTLETQLSYYGTGVVNAVTRDTDLLSPYKQLFPRTPSGNYYRFPYFSDINFELNTPEWKTLDFLEQMKKATTEGLGVLFGSDVEQAAEKTFDVAGKVTGAALGSIYPKVGIMDRPKLWDMHQYRTTEIKFPLFNTVGPDDWKKNRDLCWLLLNQNLFTKRDIITGIPPVYYEIIVPGQHYSYASSVTNLTIYNRGNMRTMLDDSDNSCVVPDVYEVNISLTDMVMPSRNLLQSLNKAGTRVTITPSGQETGDEGNRINTLQSVAALGEDGGAA
jgi:hypothetical protein